MRREKKPVNIDLTEGKPSSVLLRYCLPLFGSVIFQQLYNIADTFVAGNFISENALAAVGNSYEITLIFIAIAFGCNIGCSVIVSNYFGAKNYRDMKTSVYTSFIASGVICVLLVVFGTIFCDNLLELINTKTEIFADSKIYLDIYIWSLPFVFFYNIATGIFAAFGDSKTPFWFLACSSTANIGGDIFAVTVLGMGVDGLAWATFICQGISCVLAMIFIFKRLSAFETSKKSRIFSWKILGHISVVAVPSMLQQSFISVGNLVIQAIVNTFPVAVTAGFASATKLNNFVITSLSTFSNGISNYAGQNIGAGKTERTRKGFGASFRIIICITIPASLLYVLLSGILPNIFITNPSGLALESAASFLKIVAPFYTLISVKMIADGILRGARMMKKFMISTFTDLLLRVLLAYLLSQTSLGYNGIWMAWPIGWTIGTIVSVVFYKTIKWDKLSETGILR